MPRTVITPQTCVISGLEATYAAGDATNDHSLANGRGDIILHIVNGGGGDCIATIITPATANQGLTIEDPAITVTAGEERFIGPFDPALFNQSDGSGVWIDLDIDTSVTLAGIIIPRV